MPNNPTIKGDNTVLWGTAGVMATGIIESATKRKLSDKKMVPDNNGYDVVAVYYNHRTEFDVSVVVQTAAPTLERGDTVTIGAVTGCLVDETEEMWRMDDVRKFRLRATKHEGMTLV